MNTKIIFNLFLMALSFVACSPQQTAQSNLREALIGEWRNVSIHVTINTANNSDSSAVFAADESNWEEKLRMKPIRTFYKEDGSYISEYRNLSDSLFHTASGTWSVRGDSLILNQTQPSAETYRSQVMIKDALAEFTIRLDWDQDGNEDDLYFGVQRKQK
jgi:hypothetical protein